MGCGGSKVSNSIKAKKKLRGISYVTARKIAGDKKTVEANLKILATLPKPKEPEEVEKMNDLLEEIENKLETLMDKIESEAETEFILSAIGKKAIETKAVEKLCYYAVRSYSNTLEDTECERGVRLVLDIAANMTAYSPFVAREMMKPRGFTEVMKSILSAANDLIQNEDFDENSSLRSSSMSSIGSFDTGVFTEIHCDTPDGSKDNQLDHTSDDLPKRGGWSPVATPESEVALPEDHELKQVCLAILRNMALVDSNIPKLRRLGFVSILIPILTDQSEQNRILALATLADTMNEEESKELSNYRELFEELKTMTLDLISAGEERHQGWSLFEMGRAIRSLTKTNVNRQILIDVDALDVLFELASSEKLEVKKDALHSMWALAFEDEAITRLREFGSELEDLLKAAKRVKDPEIKAAVSGIEWELKKNNKKRAEFTGKRGHVMISYSRAHTDIIHRLHKRLKEDGFHVWIDIEQMSGDINEAMAKAVERSQVVLYTLSEKYKNSKNCKKELTYADKLEKKLIPLHVVKGYTADGWLGLVQSQALFVNFSDTEMFDEAYEVLKKEINTAMHKGHEESTHL